MVSSRRCVLTMLITGPRIRARNSTYCCSKVDGVSADAPVLTPSMRIALADLKLDELRVVYPGSKHYALSKKVEVVPLAELVKAK